jgi:hypothetical protein
MAEQIDAVVEAVQPSRPQAFVDRVGTNSGAEQLCA